MRWRPRRPCWNGGEEGDVYKGDVAVHRTGSDEPVNSVVCTTGSDGPGGPCDKAGDICKGDVALPRTVSDEPVSGVVHTSGLGGPCDDGDDFYEGDVTLHRSGSDQTVNVVVSTVGPGGLGNETGSVAVTPGDMIVMSSEYREIDKGALDKIRMWRVSPGRSRKCVTNHSTVLCLTRGCLPLICALRD